MQLNALLQTQSSPADTLPMALLVSQAHTKEVMQAVSTLAHEYSKANGVSKVICDSFIRELMALAGSVTKGTPLQMLEKKVVLLWTALNRLYVRDEFQPELCSIVNAIVRDDKDGPMLHAAVTFAVVLNKFTNAVRRSKDEKMFVRWSELPWEPLLTEDTEDNASRWARHSPKPGWVDPSQQMVTFRGTAMPAEALQFFETLQLNGKKYRTNMYLATSFKSQLIYTFIERSVTNNSSAGLTPLDADYRQPTIFIIKYTSASPPLPPCNHVNYIRPEDSAAPSPEYEFLFAPYSAFRVEQVDIRKKATLANPHRIVLSAARENNVDMQEEEEEDVFSNELPLSSWH